MDPKKSIKKILAYVGLAHPALGYKIGPERKVEAILSVKTPEQKVFIETGTFEGDMTEVMLDHFERIFTIELDYELCRSAKERLASQHNVSVLCGDSGEGIQEILQDIGEPVCFWLDAHPSGKLTLHNEVNAPVMEELKAILEHPLADEHSIAIDDARLFDRTSIRMVKQLCRRHGRKVRIEKGLFLIHAKK